MAHLISTTAKTWLSYCLHSNPNQLHEFPDVLETEINHLFNWCNIVHMFSFSGTWTSCCHEGALRFRRRLHGWIHIACLQHEKTNSKLYFQDKIGIEDASLISQIIRVRVEMRTYKVEDSSKTRAVSKIPDVTSTNSVRGNLVNNSLIAEVIDIWCRRRWRFTLKKGIHWKSNTLLINWPSER